MQPFPHHYSVVAKSDAQGDVALQGERLPAIPSAPAIEFGGPGDRWSPETLFVAAVADCFVLTFRGIAGVSRFSWTSLECSVTGTVDRIDRVTQFTALEVHSRCHQAQTRIRHDDCWRKRKRPAWSPIP